MKKFKLVCTNCGKTFSITEPNFRCDNCGEPIELDLVVVRDFIPGSEKDILKKYAEFFPFIDIDTSLSLGEGFTPLIKSNNLGKKLDINLFYKNESLNPTWSFKDRGTYIALQHAIKLGYKKIGTVSTGNMAASVAAYGAKAGLKTKILVKKGMPEEKINPIAIYNPDLIQVEGDYGSLYFKSLELGKQKGIYFMNSDSPFRVEGSKTIAFEIAEQLDFHVPDYVIVPTSAGGNIRGIIKGFNEFYKSGLTNKVPVFICAQAEGCSPICRAFNNSHNTISRFENPNTVAHAIENPYPPSGNEVLRLLRKNNGMCIAVSEEEILKSQQELAGEGLLVQPASAVSLAAVKKLKSENLLETNASIVCILTGGGLKYPSVLKPVSLIKNCRLENIAEVL